jgi:crotonobetainyl-CoA:carnitine CoA-transferase CaiB-like acyl-CoA transferase
LRKLLEERFAATSSSQLTRDLAGQQVVFEIVRTPIEMGDDPQAVANNYIVDAEQPGIGSAKRIALPLHVNGDPCRIGGPAPAHGEHTEEVLMSLIGLTWLDINQLRSRSVI